MAILPIVSEGESAMTSTPSPEGHVFLLDPGDLVELWPHGTTPAETTRHPFGTSPTPWRGRVFATTGTAVALAPEGDAGWALAILPWQWVSWARVRRARGGAG